MTDFTLDDFNNDFSLLNSAELPLLHASSETLNFLRLFAREVHISA
ncbi:MAG: hypothetical protein MJY95_06950 [Bacteroidaceae bacterium]|nr:hypothetical protein [Bacteroidaceae bacterium]